MIDPLQTVLAVWSLALGVVVVGYVIANRAPDWWLVGGLGLLELGLLVQCVIAIVQLVAGGREVATLTFVGYLVGILLVVPVATVWSLAERSRSGTAVLIVAALVVPVLILRLQQIWGA